MQSVVLCALIGSIVAVNSAQVTIRLNAQNASQEIGMATLLALGDATRVTIVVSGEPNDVIQPANIHAGRCDSVERIRYPLRNARYGRSTSVVPVPLATLMRGRFVIVVQDSRASLRAAKEYKYVSCGALP